MRRSLIDRAIKRLAPEELRRMVESINHGLGKPDYDLADLLPILIDGHHHIPHEDKQHIKSVIRELTTEELTWIADSSDRLLPDD